MTTETQLNMGQVPVAGGMVPIGPDDGMAYIMPVPMVQYVPVPSPTPTTQIIQVISPASFGDQVHGKKNSPSQLLRQVIATISTIAIGIIASCIGIAFRNVYLISLGVSGIMIGTILLAPKIVTIHIPKTIFERLAFWKKKEAIGGGVAPYYSLNRTDDVPRPVSHEVVAPREVRAPYTVL